MQSTSFTNDVDCSATMGFSVLFSTIFICGTKVAFKPFAVQVPQKKKFFVFKPLHVTMDGLG